MKQSDLQSARPADSIERLRCAASRVSLRRYSDNSRCPRNVLHRQGNNLRELEEFQSQIVRVERDLELTSQIYAQK